MRKKFSVKIFAAVMSRDRNNCPSRKHFKILFDNFGVRFGVNSRKQFMFPPKKLADPPTLCGGHLHSISRGLIERRDETWLR